MFKRTDFLKDESYDEKDLYKIYICSYLKTIQGNIEEIRWDFDSHNDVLTAIAMGVADGKRGEIPDTAKEWEDGIPQGWSYNDD